MDKLRQVTFPDDLQRIPPSLGGIGQTIGEGNSRFAKGSWYFRALVRF
jgi:hypothetical protein